MNASKGKHLTKDKEPDSRQMPASQIGIAAVGVSLCAACGVAWLNGGSGTGPSSSFAPAQTTSASSTSSAAVVDEENDVVSVQSTPQTADAGQFALIVKFRDEPMLEEIGKTFRKDPDGMRQKFRDWAAGKPALSGLTLERASYSGELVLTGTGSKSMKDAIAAIEAMDNVAYVEPDYSAKPSKEG